MSEPIKIYDCAGDEMRNATQEDIDRLMKIARSLGLHREILKKISGSFAMSDGSFDDHLAMLRKMAEC